MLYKCEYVVLEVHIHHLVNKIPIDNGCKLTGIKIKIWYQVKITVDGDCSHEIKRRKKKKKEEIKRCLLLERKAMTNLDRTLKNRDLTLPTNVHIVRAMVFLEVMCGCESWTIQKAEHQRIDAFELWCWRRLLRVPWTARRSNQSILREISPEYSLEGLILKLKV